METCLSALQGLLAEKLALLEALAALSQRQTTALQAEDVQGLSDVLQQKQELIDRVDQQDIAIAVAWSALRAEHGIGDWDQLADWPGGQSVLCLRVEIRALLQSLLQQDEVQRAESGALLKRLLQLLQELGDGANAMKMYAEGQPGSQASSLFVNRKL